MEKKPGPLKAHVDKGELLRQGYFDEVLRKGLRAGPEGQRKATELLLSHLSGVTRGEIWKRTRIVREEESGHRGGRLEPATWSPEALDVLKEGYRWGGRKKSEAISLVVEMCPGLTRRKISRHARREGWGGGNGTASAVRRNHTAWDEMDKLNLFNLAGYKPVGEIAEDLGRTQAAVRCRLAANGLSARVKDAYSLRALTKNLHLGFPKLGRLIADDKLRVRNPQVSRESQLSYVSKNRDVFGEDYPELETSTLLAGPDGYLRNRVATMLRKPEDEVKELLACGELKVVDTSVTDRALEDFLRKYGKQELNLELFTPGELAWLEQYGVEVRQVAPKNSRAQKHARKGRTCPRCGLVIRGNVYGVHVRACEKKEAKQTQEASRGLVAGSSGATTAA
jgi:predicted transcriptional regulator